MRTYIRMGIDQRRTDSKGRKRLGYISRTVEGVVNLPWGAEGFTKAVMDLVARRWPGWSLQGYCERERKPKENL